jgi:hypothetical protein
MLRLVLSAAVLVLVLVIDSISCFCVRLGNTIDKTINARSLIAVRSRGHRGRFRLRARAPSLRD